MGKVPKGAKAMKLTPFDYDVLAAHKYTTFARSIFTNEYRAQNRLAKKGLLDKYLRHGVPIFRITELGEKALREVKP